MLSVGAKGQDHRGLGTGGGEVGGRSGNLAAEVLTLPMMDGTSVSGRAERVVMMMTA